MRILIVGAGKMGTFLTDVLCTQHEVALYARRPESLRFVFNTLRMTKKEEVAAFQPELMINCVSLNHTFDAFNDMLPYLPKECILSDIASVKTGLPEFYAQSGHRFVSTHPMFGPTFANLENLSHHNAILISESDPEGKEFFRQMYASLHLNIFDYTFEAHDETIAYSLSIPFVSTMTFAAVMKHQDAPGTTFQKHMEIARGLFSEDDYLLTEILFNPHTLGQVDKIRAELKDLMSMIEHRDTPALQAYLKKLRENIK